MGGPFAQAPIKNEVEASMLVLTRKPGQSILIGDGIEVQILSSAREKVRVGIIAPRDISIFRNEVKERIERAALRS